MSVAPSPPLCLVRAAQSGPAAVASKLRNTTSAGAAESNSQNLSHSPSLIASERPGEGQDTGVQVRLGNLAINGGEPGFIFTGW